MDNIKGRISEKKNKMEINPGNENEEISLLEIRDKGIESIKDRNIEVEGQDRMRQQPPK